MWSRVGVLAATLACLLGAGTATAAPNYVALGDSYAAGPLIPLQLQPYGCLKSSSNYAHFVAPRVGLPLRDSTCSGASTRHMTEPQGVTPGPNPPQFNALDADTRLVTLQIGGNDIGFSGIAQDCVDVDPNGPSCASKFTVDGQDVVQARIATTAQRVRNVLAGIKARSPLAKILVVDYPAIFPHSGGGCPPLLPVANASVPYLRGVHQSLNAMIAAEAATAGATLVPAYASSTGRDACSLPLLRWVEPAVPLHAAAPLHPNIMGMLGMADLVVARR
ncbi:MAG TPA: SGNH/GDSL hydrolase family protein [Solirubrobacteraceae bacterium]